MERAAREAGGRVGAGIVALGRPVGHWTGAVNLASGTLQEVPVEGAFHAGVNASSNDARIHTGWVVFRIDYFLNIQGISDMTANGTTMIGGASSVFGTTGFAIKSPEVVMCDKAPGNPKGKAFTIDVSFPGGLADHTIHGDTLGMCQHGGL